MLKHFSVLNMVYIMDDLNHRKNGLNYIQQWKSTNKFILDQHVLNISGEILLS